MFVDKFDDGSSFVARPKIELLIKRIFDFSFSFLAIISLSLVFVLVGLLVKLSSSGPMFYGHSRVGLNGKTFTCWKFRTMFVDADERLTKFLNANSHARKEFFEKRKLASDPRVIPIVGSFLRKTSLDEIPQFINVLLGDMSVVGPRPVTLPELDRYGQSKVEYLSVRPGITGAWQVSGRSRLSFEERVLIDVNYVRGWSLLRDIRIVLKTIVVVFSCRDAV
ncbi:sugar transferase [Ovoidimarina sediminis]|uniref:sugar transferase n=1 Tax=Ovoidimarina sediminis TaxID=3079856 RepID=UPI0029110DC6|nr:sugar transferase [Rhodophyticola sp. MJ-SS7]MDU8945538.1 sugar transferase [Rhodophyticola sp. MJ-SS7]